MQDAGELAIGAAAVGGIFGLVFWVRQRRLLKPWRAFAERRGLRCSQDSFFFARPRVSGLVGGRAVRLWTFARSKRIRVQGGRYGTLQEIRTALQLPLRCSVPPGLHIHPRRRGTLSKDGEVLGAQEVEIGDPRFDRGFELRGDDPDAVRAWLTPDRQRAIEASDAEVRQDELYVRQVGTIRSPAELDRLLDDHLEVADTIEADGS